MTPPKQLLRMISLLLPLFVSQLANANAEFIHLSRGCEIGAQLLHKAAKGFESDLMKLTLDTSPSSIERRRRLKSYNDNFEKIKDILYAQQMKVESGLPDELNRGRAQLIYGAQMVAVDVAPMLIDIHVEKENFSTSSER
ncbi:MAG: hypothetical protein WCT47_17395 [Betaproteobacteria bacterium]